MKITYLINQYPKASHAFIRREIVALERQGFDVQRIAIRGWDRSLTDVEDEKERERTQYVLKDGLRALIVPTVRVFWRSPRVFLAALRLAFKMVRTSYRSIFYHLAYLAEACRILFWVRDFGADRIHAHFGTNSAEVVMFVRMLGGPRFSFTVHGPEEFLEPMSLEEKVHRSDFVVAISSFGRSQMYMRTRHDDWPKINVVHRGVEPSYQETAATTITEAPRIVCVGRLSEANGQVLLVDAVLRLRAMNIPIELVLAGDGPKRAEIERLIAEHDLGDRIRITGTLGRRAVRDEILAARALISPSFDESMPVGIVDAMALRRPVLATYVAGIPELVRHGENGWLFAAGSVGEATQALRLCLQASTEELQRMGDAAYERINRRHGSDSEAEKLGALFLSPDPQMHRTECLPISGRI
jgi:glycosyltransferase involved in cell wall biosynthesis